MPCPPCRSQLGILAQARGDYDEAERRHRQSLEISERLGDRVGIATSISQLGLLSGQLGTNGEAIAWRSRALAIRFRLQLPQILIDLQALARYREELGVERFIEAFDAAAGPGTANGIQALPA